MRAGLRKVEEEEGSKEAVQASKLSSRQVKIALGRPRHRWIPAISEPIFHIPEYL